MLEDAEDGTTGDWRIFDNTPAGPTIDKIANPDSASRVISLSGADQQNSFILGSISAANGLNLGDLQQLTGRREKSEK